MTKARGQTAKGEIAIDEKSCKGCGYCTAFCPNSCITMPGDKFTAQGYLLPAFSKPEACTACGTCGRMCPDFAIEVYKYAGERERRPSRSVSSTSSM